MTISFRCENPACGKSLRVNDEAVGKKVKCPRCGQVTGIPTQMVGPLPGAATPISGSPTGAQRSSDTRAKLPRLALWACVTGAAVVLILGGVTRVYFYNRGQAQAPSTNQVENGLSPIPVVNSESKVEAETPPPAPQPLPADLQAVWTSSGAKIGWSYLDDGSFRMIADPTPAPSGKVPAFHMSQFKATLPNMPTPEQEFGLDFSFSDYITDSRLKELASFGQLCCLNLGATRITDAGLKELTGLQHMKVLVLSRTGVKAPGMKDVAKLKHLQVLQLHGVEVTDAGLRELTALKQLRMLDLNGAWVTDAGVGELKEFRQLRALDLAGNSVTGAGFRELAALKQLRVLDLYETQMKDTGMKELAALEQLQSLSIGGQFSPVTDTGVKELASLKHLEALKLNNVKMTDDGMKALGKLDQLQSLSLSQTTITDEGLKELASLKKLQSLDLYGTKVTDAGLKELVALKQLQSLELSYTQVTDAGLESLAGLVQLKKLRLTGTKVTEAGLNQLAPLQQLQIHPLTGDVVAVAGKVGMVPMPPSVPAGENWQHNPTAFAGLFFGGNLKKRTADEARDLTYPKDVEKKVAGTFVEWDGKVLPGPVSGGKNGNVLVISAGEDCTILIKGTSGYKDGDKFVSIEEQLKSLPILTRVKLTMKVRTPVNALIAFDGGPMLVLDGDDAKVSQVQSK
jgi:internalin A